MGWLYFERPRGMTPAEILKARALRWNVPAELAPEIVAECQTGAACFFAVRYSAAYLAEHMPRMAETYVPELDGSITFALVLLFKSEGGEFGYKDMDETAGPYETGPSGAFLSKLSALQDSERAQWAREWRARCEAANGLKSARRAIKPGATVRLASPLRFTDGAELSEFKAENVPQWRGGKIAQRLVFRSVQNGALYRLTARNLEGAAVA